MPISEAFTEYIVDQLSSWGEVTSRRMFGGAGLYRDGKMFGLIADDVVYLKVDDSNRQAFIDAGCGPFKPYPDKPTEMSYYDVPPDVLETPPEFVEWAQRSLAIQLRKP
ncbi:MAG: TfoX/Sxy family protein [Verrucomicrobia bacterium]|jgi:DNA transformation protein and related proteins|nr:TfoX/Sxy family protein [Verrucomicrobiota bacterium]MBT7066600.1 TfoX/Sxy family protein [Verrucomicrobiota bacterium]MBT7699774.1 TfoX/Sxy family protein [Verrucomicrobiota bacterium]